MTLFSDPLHDEFASWALGFAPYGGADVGEVELLATQVKPATTTRSSTRSPPWRRRRIDEGDEAAAKGHARPRATATCAPPASSGVAYHPLYGTPVDARLVDAFHLQMDTFDKAMALGDPPAEKLDIPYEGTTLPAYFLRAPGHENEVRPVILVGGGWDSTVVENYLGIGVAALQRGYHVLLHDGPGQGRLLIDEGLPLRHDWEKVVTPVVDAALRDRRRRPRPHRLRAVEPRRLHGAAGRRLRAPPRGHRRRPRPDRRRRASSPARWRKLGLSDEAVAKLPHLDPEDEAKIMKVIDGDRALHWKIVQRGFWTNGASDLSSWLAEMDKWKLDAETVAADPLPDAGHGGRVRHGVVERQGALRRADLPQDLHPVHRCRRRGHALRDGQPVDGQPQDPRLARRHAELGPWVERIERSSR